MIRLANESDVPRLVEMGRRFRRASEYRHHLVENPEQIARTMLHLVATNGVLVSERDEQIVGMIGFVLFPHFFSGELVCGELFWWVEPEHRGAGIKLLREAEKRARDAGARRMQMIAPNDKVGTLYGRLGYAFVEAAYQRSL